jgi:D-glycero-alpha-D-manno-heptose-7-phosphate kinase
MIISRTPFRVSFVGGGTDLESFCSVEPGAVISTSINRYVYVTVKRQVAIASHRYRISWNKLEFANTLDEIEHPIVREALRKLEIDFPIEVTTFADIPSSTGLGSSSAFAVGLLNALHALKGERRTKSELAQEAAEIEIRILNRKIGMQDHLAAAYGSVNIFNFYAGLKSECYPIFYKPEILAALQSNLFMFYTEMQRSAFQILEQQSRETVDKMAILRKMKDLVEPVAEVFTGKRHIDDMGHLLHENWVLKRQLTQGISNPKIEEYYERGLRSGALGGKLLGAGGGGFMLFYAPPKAHHFLKAALPNLFQLNFAFDHAGSRITYYDRSNMDDDAEVMIDYGNQ